MLLMVMVIMGRVGRKKVGPCRCVTLRSHDVGNCKLIGEIRGGLGAEVERDRRASRIRDERKSPRMSFYNA